MIAKISSTENLGGALGYNFKKVQHNEAAVLCVNELRKGFDGTFQMDKVLADMQKAIPEQCRTKKTVFHCSLNPHPDEKLSDERLTQIAKEYMEALGNPISSLSIMTLPVSIFTSFRFEWISMVIKSMTSLRAGEARRLLMLWKRNITSFQVQRSVREQQQKHQRSMLCKGISRNKWQILFVLR